MRYTFSVICLTESVKFIFITQQLCHVIKFIYTSLGITLVHNGEHVTLRAILLSGIFDLPAKCLIQEMVQFNGAFGCSFCEVPGKSLKTDNGGHVMVFPQATLTEKAFLRTNVRVMAQAMVALEQGEIVSFTHYYNEVVMAQIFNKITFLYRILTFFFCI